MSNDQVKRTVTASFLTARWNKRNHLLQPTRYKGDQLLALCHSFGWADEIKPVTKTGICTDCRAEMAEYGALNIKVT